MESKVKLKEFNHINKISGALYLPGDKSISHRSVMFSALAKGKSEIRNLSNGEDVKSTINIFRAMGINADVKNEIMTVNGLGFKGLQKSDKPLNAGNSGTTTRLLSGILAGQNFESVIIGDEYLSVRPMKRILDPLRMMGARIEASDKNTLPLRIYPVEKLDSIAYELPVASAQVKSAVLLAGLFSDEVTSVIENYPSRDHTERMLGLKTEEINGKKISYSSRNNYPDPKEYFVPSDISTAAFFIVLGLLVKNSDLVIKNVSLNKTRTGIIDILKQMGGKIFIENYKEIAGEALGDIHIRNSELRNIKIPQEIIPNIIDEIPVLSVAGLFADGDFIINNAEELRGKETDRIKALCENYKLLGLNVEEWKDGFRLSGNIKNIVPVFESYYDHRIAMAFSVLSLLLKNGGKVNNFGCVSISNPAFLEQLESITIV